MQNNVAMPPAVELRGLTKAFKTVVANDGVNLHVSRGTIHGVIGENGAGKSTAMKMLYGIYSPDAGEILIDGKVSSWRSPHDAIAAGIGMVHQHFMLAGPYSALDNILLGAEPSPSWARWLPRSLRPVARREARMKLEVIARQYGLPVDWDVPVENLPVGIQQRIEIIKLLYRDAKILILDEPTAVLTPQETSELFANLRKMRDEGKTIIIITHKLKEVMSLTDRVTVFRAGKVTGEVETANTSAQELANLMVGRKVSLQVEVPPPPPLGETVLDVCGLTLRAVHGQSTRHHLDGVSFKIRAGEVVGIAGVEGNGQSELIQAIMHPHDPSCLTSGTVQVVKPMGVIPEDRLKLGLLPERSLEENFLLGLHNESSFKQYGFLNGKELRRAALKALDEYDVRPRVLEVEAGRLSGGNQQKLIIAREFERKPYFLIAAQPTRGVDVGAIEFIHKRILKARTEGAGVLLVSSELEEVLALSDRILVMYEGAIVGEFSRGQVSERELGLRMGGHARATC
jgi:simple sugar transport system ATP-binding protein